MNRWESTLSEYMEELEVRGLVEQSKLRISGEISKFGMWLRQGKPKPRIEEIGMEKITMYLKRRSKFKSRSTISSHISTLRCFGEFLVRKGLWRENPLKWLKGPKILAYGKVARRVSQEQIYKIMEAIISNRDSIHRQLYSSLLLVLYGTGLRRGELVRLNMADWDKTEMRLQIDGQKTGRPRRVPVPIQVAEAIESWLPHRQNILDRMGKKCEEALFINKNGNRVTGEQVTRNIQNFGKKGQIKDIRIHQFRHSCASDLVEAGVEMHKVSEVLGHSCLTTTKRYMEISDPQRRAAMVKHPINEMIEKQEVVA